jgi:hypothetical protein
LQQKILAMDLMSLDAWIHIDLKNLPPGSLYDTNAAIAWPSSRMRLSGRRPDMISPLQLLAVVREIGHQLGGVLKLLDPPHSQKMCLHLVELARISA